MSRRVEWLVRDREGDWPCSDEETCRHRAREYDLNHPIHAPHRVIRRAVTITETDVTDAGGRDGE